LEEKGMNINDLCKKAHENAVNKGFWEEEGSFAEQIALMHSELSEALEEYRNKKPMDFIYFSNCSNGCESLTKQCKTCSDAKPEGIPIELADVLIRIFDTCGHYGIDLEQAIEMKMKYNEGRPHKHGKVI
jgi:NTP pyrophosphatase (non-canonical NTP hydrolase)